MDRGALSMGVSRVGCDLVTKPPPPPLIYGTVSEKEEPQKDKPQLWRRGGNICQGQFPISVTKLLAQIISNLKVQYWVFKNTDIHIFDGKTMAHSAI